MSAVSRKPVHTAREALVESHIPLVQSVARRFANSGEPLEDLIQVGSVGLVKAGNRFDESRGVAFAAFAAPVIEGEIRRHLRDRCAPMRIPRDLQRASGELRRQRDHLAASSGHTPSTRELAAALKIDEEQIERALRAELTRDAVPLRADGEVGEQRDEHDQRLDSEDRLSLAHCLRALDERERKLIFMRFHADLTERQIGRELGISQPQVSRLLGAALARLRTELEDANASGGQGDIAVNRPISPASGDDPAAKDARKSARNGSKQRNAADKIAGVPVAQDTVSVAQYLELPYTVAVHCEREGEKSVWNATAEELPGCAAQGRTPDEAVELLRGAMESWIEAALAQGREVPVPGAQAKQQTSPSHSGRFLVRMPSVLHTQLAEAAEREHLSLNRFITKLLAASVSAPASTPRPRRDSDARSASATPSRGFRIALATNVAVMVLAALGAIVLLVLALQHGV